MVVRREGSTAITASCPSCPDVGGVFYCDIRAASASGGQEKRNLDFLRCFWLGNEKQNSGPHIGVPMASG